MSAVLCRWCEGPFIPARGFEKTVSCCKECREWGFHSQRCRLLWPAAEAQWALQQQELQQQWQQQQDRQQQVQQHRQQPLRADTDWQQ